MILDWISVMGPLPPVHIRHLRSPRATNAVFELRILPRKNSGHQEQPTLCLSLGSYLVRIQLLMKLQIMPDSSIFLRNNANSVSKQECWFWSWWSSTYPHTFVPFFEGNTIARWILMHSHYRSIFNRTNIYINQGWSVGKAVKAADLSPSR